MATLHPGEKSRMYALGGLARGGAFRGGYVSSRVFLNIDGIHVGFGGTGAGHVGTIIDSLTITDELDDTPNTCVFRVNGTVPATGAEVVVTLGSKNRVGRLFAGFALTVQQLYAADRPVNVQADVRCVDYTWHFDFVKVTARYHNQSASAIAADLISRYAAVNGFTSLGVVPGLPVLDEITFTNEDLAQALTRLARRIGGYWSVDYQRDVHVFLDRADPPPEPLIPTHRSLAQFRKAADRTQVLTRVYVEGRGTRFLGAVAPGDSMIPLEAVDMFAAASDVFAKVSPQGSDGGAQHLTYTGVVPGGGGSLVGPGVGPPGPPTLAPLAAAGLNIGRYAYAYTDVTATGETRPSPIATIDIGGLFATPTLAPTVAAIAAGGAIPPGVHNWAYTFTSPGGETPPSPATAFNTNAVPITPTGGISGIGYGSGGVFPANTWFAYRVTYVGSAGGETTEAVYGGVAMTDMVGPDYISLSIGGTVAPVPAGITGVRVYRTRGGANSAAVVNGPFLFAGTASHSGVNWYFDDFCPDVALGAAIPTTNTAVTAMGTVRVSCPVGGAGITGRKLYRTALGAGALQLVAAFDNAAAFVDDATADTGLGATAPAVNTAGAEYRAVTLSDVAPGPPGTIARYLYRTAVNDTVLRIWGQLGDNVSTVVADGNPDASLGAAAPTSDTSGLQQGPGQVAAGSTTLLVANAAPFQAAGGWAVIGNGEQVVRYTGTSGPTLVGIPAAGIGAIGAGVAYNSTVTAAPMITGIPATGAGAIQTALVSGDELYLVVRRDDAARQGDLAGMVHVGPGIREEWIQDRRLSITEARARGDATLALRPLEDVTVTYTCRDLRTASGQTIVVNLPPPTNVFGTFTIQAVTIANFRPFPTQYPTFTVTASSQRFSFEDWLRRLTTKE